MKKNNIGYLLREGFRGVFLHGFMSFAAICVTVACLIIMGSFCLILYNTSAMVKELEQENEMLVYIDESYSEAKAKSVGSQINLITNVRSAVFVSREQALEVFIDEQNDASLFAGIDRLTAERSRVGFASEGGSASGKTTLGELLQNVYGCPVFHMDDFFLRPEQRAEARFAQPGGNVDRERFLSEVLLPLRQGKMVDYRRFDCATFTIAPPQRIEAGTLNIVEGAYSMHPNLAPYYDLSVFLPISAEKQRERILKRNAPAHAKQFFDRWIPFEQRYFDALDVRNRCDLILSADG